MKEGVSCIISAGGNGYVVEERERGMDQPIETAKE